jgi:hypothetical protein
VLKDFLLCIWKNTFDRSKSPHLINKNRDEKKKRIIKTGITTAVGSQFTKLIEKE